MIAWRLGGKVDADVIDWPAKFEEVAKRLVWIVAKA